MDNTRAAFNEHWEGLDRLHRIVAVLLALVLAVTWWLGHPTADRPGWCASASSSAVAAAPPEAAAPPVVALPAAAPHIEVVAPAVQAPTPPPAARVFFATNDSRLGPQATGALAEVLAYLKADTSAKASIVGFHDPSGNPEANNALAKARAKAVSAALVAAGVAENQLSLDKPRVTTGSGTASEARRVEVSIKP